MSGSETSHARHTVLVVDDSRDMREAVAAFFECAGLGVTAVANGLEALHLMGTLGLRPCAVLADLIMPVMDGLTLGKRMAEDPSLATIPLVALTGHEGLRRFALTEGYVAGFLKPAELQEIVAVIRTRCPWAADAKRRA